MVAPSLHPMVEWAQRDKLLYLTVEIDNVVDLEVSSQSLHVKGTYGGSKTIYEATLDFYAEIKTDYRKIDNNRHLELVINKETANWWPRLLKSSTKLPWVKVDFNKWKEEDDEDDMSGGDFDFQNYMSKLGDSGGSGPNLDDFGDDDDDKDEDDDMPDLEDDDIEGYGEEGTKDEKVKVDDEQKDKKVEEAGDKKEEFVQQS